MSMDLFREAIKAAHNGRRQDAHNLLQELLMGQPRHELGWWWLSKVAEDVDEQIRALETVLILNPAHEEAIHRLPELKAQRKQQEQNDQAALYQEAVWAYKNGRHPQARQYLHQLVRQNPSHLKAWLGLAQVAHSPAEKIVALETALTLNPEHEKAAIHLKKLRANFDDPLALAQAYEAVHLTGKAVAAYHFAAQNAPHSADRHMAGKHARKLQAAQQKWAQDQQKKAERPIVFTSENANLVRLGFGPLLVYLLLIFIHGGLNPLHIPWLAYLGIPLVAMGSLLIAGAANTPHHIYWHKLFGPQGIPNHATALALAVVGFLIVFIPIMLVLTVSYDQLLVYHQALSSAVR
jgi:tetratricopeptide (TPR) repeat protein